MAALQGLSLDDYDVIVKKDAKEAPVNPEREKLIEDKVSEILAIKAGLNGRQ